MKNTNELRLGVNIDHVATLRQARGTKYPEPIIAAGLAELAGAHQITVHVREDRRHMQDRDLEILRHTVGTLLNLEMANTNEMVRLALKCRPDRITFVPEKRQELTTEGGLDVRSELEQLKKAIELLKEAGIVTSLFINPDLDQVKAAHMSGAEAVEFHTGRYCGVVTEKDREGELRRIQDAVKMASKLRLEVAAGHGLNYNNVIPIARVPEIVELNIGHSIVSRAVLLGMERAVKDMLDLMQKARA